MSNYPFAGGFVMLDNTTLFGAARAFEWDPRQPRIPSGVDLRSLMDVLESIVLVDKFGVDRSSREQPIWWPDLNETSNNNGQFFQEYHLVRPGGPSYATLIQTAIRQLQQMLISGELIDQLGFMPTSNHVEMLPSLYRDLTHFAHLTLRGISGPEEAILTRQLDEFSQVFQRQDLAVQNFAYFAFRGFYYQTMAHSAGVSYMPHAWRSGLIRSQLTERAPTPFADFVMKVVGQVRGRAQDQINDALGLSVISAEFPLIASYVISQCDTRGALLKTAAEIRRSPKAAALRAWIRRFEYDLRNESNLLSIRQAQDELHVLVRELEQDLGLGRSERQKVTLTFGFPMLSAQVNTNLLRRPSWSRLHLRRRPHLVFLRELARESTRLAPFSVTFLRMRT
ncbi:hypothetical protein AB0H18_46255 [Streptomyces sp. NPDC020766]|uniref:hypothetical protein n=1 Tax=Streptomyces sp. NPDC020766 TaxID=3155011 RepID=UPI0033DB5573